MITTKRLGVIGGLGPIATAYFYELVIKMTDARIDQEHLEMLIFSKPSIPDRTEYILGKSKNNPLYDLIEIGKVLADMGADYIAIPCITAHYFHDQLAENIKVPIIHIVNETVQYLKLKGFTKVGIMATEGTIYSGLFQKELERNAMVPIIPSVEMQALVTNLIYQNVKANTAVDITKFRIVSEELFNHGAEAIILGCTELSLIKRDYEIGSGYLDAMEVLAKRAIELTGAKLNKEYYNMIT